MSEQKYCLTKYLEYKEECLPRIKEILQEIATWNKRQASMYKETYLTKENVGIYSNGIRHRMVGDQHQVEIIQRYQTEFGYMFRHSQCQSDPLALLKQIGYKEQNRHQIDEKVWHNYRFQLSAHFHLKHHILELRQLKGVPFEKQTQNIPQIIAQKLSTVTTPIVQTNLQYLRPRGFDIKTHSS